MTAPKYHIETWGCQMNVLDSQRMAGLLEGQGFEKSEDARNCDLLLLNTCDIREKAEWKVYSELGRFSDWKRQKPGRVIGVAGCVAQRAGDAILDRLPFVDFAVGTGNIERLPEAVNAAREEGRRSRLLDFRFDVPSYQFQSIARDSKFQAYITVIEGCDQYCTFCTVPFTRGRERSRRAFEICQEAEELARKGYTEITLLGQTVNAYSCPETALSLAGLLKKLARVESLRRIRFITSHPSFVTTEFIEVFSEEKKIARFFHLPAQSGSDRILSRMKRRYTSGRYREIVDSLRQRSPDAAISSDFIVGFPGESEEDFGATLNLIEEIQFSSVFAFVYSPRPGTAAHRWGREAELPVEQAKARLDRLFELQRAVQKRNNRNLEGSVLDVLVEGEHEGRGTLSGRSSCNRIVHFEKPARQATTPGSYVGVRIERGLENSLVGRLVLEA
jgi:tRNA-2-methylthio-N6-dimethylallyladenosine synthase